MDKKNLKKKVLELCKKVKKCPKCSRLNGTVKKATAAKGAGGSFLKIVHDLSKGSEKNEHVVQELG